MRALLDADRDLDDEQREYLTVHGVLRICERRIIPVGPANPRNFGRCALLAADAFVRYLKTPAQRWFGSVRFVCRAMGEWNLWVMDLANRQVRGEALPPLELAVLSHWHSQNTALGIPRLTDQFIAEAMTQNEMLGLPADKESVLADIRVYRHLTRGTADGGTFVGKDRRMRLGRRQWRTIMANFHNLPRSGDRDPVVHAKGPNAVDQDGEDPLLLQVPARVEEFAAAETIQQVQRALDALPPGLPDLIAEARDGLDAETVLDALSRAATATEPAVKAAIIRRAWDNSISREDAARVFETSVSKIRTAELKKN